MEHLGPQRRVGGARESQGDGRHEERGSFSSIATAGKHLGIVIGDRVATPVVLVAHT